MSGEDTILVTLTHTIEAIPKYGDIKAHRDLPDAFHAVTECRQLVRNIVKALQGPIKKGPKSDSYKAVEKSLNDCKDKAAGLKGLFEAVIGQAPRNDYSESKLSSEANQMKRMLENVLQLATAEETMVPVHITNQSNGIQHINTGSGTQNGNYGSGQQYIAQSQNFGSVPIGHG